MLAALRREPVDRPPAVNPTSVATVGLMDLAGARFPEANRVPELMARLAAAGRTALAFDSVMPVFSVVQESSALGCRVSWGENGVFPAVLTREPLCREPGDIRIPSGFLDHPDVRCVLEAIRMLRRHFGNEVAVLGKAMGPWTLAYHCFGLEPFLLMTADDPRKASRCLELLKEVTVLFGQAQIDAGADALTLPDHATGDLVSGEYYRRFLRDLHSELAARLPAPLILHICGRTLDRMEWIAQTGVAAFHFDSKNPPGEAIRIARGRIALAGSVNCPATLRTRGPREVRAEVLANVEAGVPLIGPECAVPLETPLENLAEIPRSILAWATERV